MPKLTNNVPIKSELQREANILIAAMLESLHKVQVN